jgi:hypothetical protein
MVKDGGRCLWWILRRLGPRATVGTPEAIPEATPEDLPFPSFDGFVFLSFRNRFLNTFNDILMLWLYKLHWHCFANLQSDHQFTDCEQSVQPPF